MLKKFLDALKPKLFKVDILSDIENQRKELQEFVLPGFNEFNKTFTNYTFKSDVVKNIDSIYRRVTNESSKVGLFVLIEKDLTEVLKALDELETSVDKNFTDTVYRSAMTFTQANIIQMVSTIGFLVRYARNLNTLALIEEADKEDLGSDIKMVNAEINRITDQSRKFVNSLTIVAKSANIINKTLDKIPVSNIDDESLAINTGNRSVLDPFALNLLDTGFNPFYFIGMIVAERQAANYHEAKEDYEIQQSLLLNLKLAQQRQNDAKLELKIQRQIERIQKLRRSLNDMEQKYGLKN
jgi:hypothetical protein